jgi:hypothetical protein
MGRRKKSGNPAALLILGIFALLLFTLLIVFWIIFGWIFYEFKFRKVGNAKDKDFELLDDETDYLKELRSDKVDTEQNIQNLLEEGSELSRRQDGYFSERSNLGKELNKKLTPLIEDGKHYENKIYEIEQRPFDKFNYWKDLRAKRLTYRNTFYIFILSNIFFFGLLSDYLSQIGEITQRFSSIFLPVIDNTLMGLLVASSWTSFISFWIINAYLVRNLGKDIKLKRY